MLFDSHTHIHFPIYDGDRDQVLSRAKVARVKMLLVGTQASTSASAIALAEENPGDAWATVGFHPNHLAGSEAAPTPVLEGTRKPEGVRSGGRGIFILAGSGPYF